MIFLRIFLRVGFVGFAGKMVGFVGFAGKMVGLCGVLVIKLFICLGLHQ